MPLELLRSDIGDGGWSLGYQGEDRYIIVLSGESEQSDGAWERPNANDYALARELATEPPEHAAADHARDREIEEALEARR